MKVASSLLTKNCEYCLFGMQTELEMAKNFTASSVSFSRKIEGDCTLTTDHPKKLAAFTHFKLAKRENWCHIATRVEQIASAWTKVFHSKPLKLPLFFNLYIYVVLEKQLNHSRQRETRPVLPLEISPTLFLNQCQERIDHYRKYHSIP